MDRGSASDRSFVFFWHFSTAQDGKREIGTRGVLLSSNWEVKQNCFCICKLYVRYHDTINCIVVKNLRLSNYVSSTDLPVLTSQSLGFASVVVLFFKSSHSKNHGN